MLSIYVLFLLCLIWFSSDCMGIWNKDFVGQCIQTTRSSSKILRSVSYFRVVSVFRSVVKHDLKLFIHVYFAVECSDT